MAWPMGSRGAIPPSAQTAQTLILVGLILESLFALFFIGAGLLLLLVFVGVFFLIAGIVGVLILFLVYTFTYARIREGDFAGARTPTLIWTIICFVTLSIVPAILFLVAYIKLGDAMTEVPQAYGMPYATGPSYVAPYAPMPFSPAPAAAAPATAWPAPPQLTSAAPIPSSPPVSPCPRCGNPLSFIPQYNRWYCNREQTYL